MEPVTSANQQESEALLDFIYLCPMAIAQLDGQGAIEMMNPLGVQILMQIVAAPVVENLFDALASCAPDLRGLASGLTADQGVICEDLRVDTGRTSPRTGLPLVVALTMIKLNPTRTMAVFADVSRSVAQEHAAHAAEHRFRAILDGVRDCAIFSISADGAVENWNKSAERIFGFTSAEVMGRSLVAMFGRDPLQRVRADDMLRRAAEDGWAEEEGWWSRKEHTRFWGSTAFSQVEGERGARRGFVCITRDLTGKKREEDDLRARASTDVLTGASNRRGFMELGAAELARFVRDREPLSAVMIDADHFKAVNDTHGHAAGDDVLRAIARAARDQVRDVDLVGRLGGEEFAILLPSTDGVGARAAAERIRMAIEATCVQREGRTLRVTVSAGVAQATTDTLTLDDLLAAADGALFEAKRRGRNRTVLAAAVAPAAAPRSVRAANS